MLGCTNSKSPSPGPEEKPSWSACHLSCAPGTRANSTELLKSGTGISLSRAIASKGQHQLSHSPTLREAHQHAKGGRVRKTGGISPISMPLRAEDWHSQCSGVLQMRVRVSSSMPTLP